MSVPTAIKERATEYHQAIIDRNPMAEAWGLDEAYIKGATDRDVIRIADCKRILEIVENSSKQYMPSDKYKEMVDNIEVILNT